jgi:predicted nucleic acid-binding protein
MILVDTSVLVDYLAGRQNESVKKMELIVDRKIVFGINVYIYQELLQGTASKRDFEKLKSYLDTMTFYSLASKESYSSAADIYFRCRRSGVTVRSTIDCIIAQTAIENDLELLHNDTDFDMISRVIKNLRSY